MKVENFPWEMSRNWCEREKDFTQCRYKYGTVCLRGQIPEHFFLRGQLYQSENDEPKFAVYF